MKPVKIDKIAAFKDLEGQPSLQNALELSLARFKSVPSYGHKEVLVIFSSITNCDPGNVFEAFDRLATERVQCSVISLSAGIYMLQKLCERTQGDFMLSKTKEHFQDLLKRCLVPKGFKEEQAHENVMVKMAFPERIVIVVAP